MKNPKRVFKGRVYEQLARIGKALASPQRLELLDLLSQGPRTVENLAQEVQPNGGECLPASASPARGPAG